MEKETTPDQVILKMSHDEYRAFTSGIQNAWDLLASSFRPALATVTRPPLPEGMALSPPNRNQRPVSLLDSEEHWQAWANRHINGLLQTVEALQGRLDGLDKADARKGDLISGVERRVAILEQLDSSVNALVRRVVALELDEIPKELERIPQIEARLDRVADELKAKVQHMEAPHEFSPAIGGNGMTDPEKMENWPIQKKFAYDQGFKAGQLETTRRFSAEVEAWIKFHRDEFGSTEGQWSTEAEWRALDVLLDDWREHMQTGTPLSQAVVRTHQDEQNERLTTDDETQHGAVILGNGDKESADDEF